MKLLFLWELISGADFPLVLRELIVSCVFRKQNLVKWPGNTSQIIPPLHKAVLQGDAVEFLFSWWSFNHSSFKHAAQQRPDARQCKVSAESLCTTATLPKSVIVQVAKLGWVNGVQLCKATHWLTTENVEKQQGKEAGILCSRACGVFSLFCAEEYVLLVLSQGKRKISLGRIVSSRNDWQTHTEAHSCRYVIASYIREQLLQEVLNAQLSNILYSVLRIRDTGICIHRSERPVKFLAMTL